MKGLPQSLSWRGRATSFAMTSLYIVASCLYGHARAKRLARNIGKEVKAVPLP